MSVNITADAVDKYLYKVFGNLSYDSQAAAARMQKNLGIDMLPEDADLLLTWSVVQMLNTEVTEYPKIGSTITGKTSFYREFSHTMRADMELQLRGSIAKLQAEGLSYEDAVREALSGPVLLVDQRFRVEKAADAYFRERVFEPALPKSDVVRDSIALGTLFTLSSVVAVALGVFHMPLAGGVVALVTLPSLAGVWGGLLSLWRPVRVSIATGVQTILNREHRPDVTLGQKLRFNIYKTLNSPGSWISPTTFSSILLVGLSGSVLVETVIKNGTFQFCLTSAFAIYLSILSLFLSRRLWIRRQSNGLKIA